MSKMFTLRPQAPGVWRSQAQTRSPLWTSIPRLGRWPVWLLLVFACLSTSSLAQSTWQEALARMPLTEKVTALHQTNTVPLMLRSFQSNAVVKAMVFMPYATDEFFFFRRVNVPFPHASPTLMDAVAALTNHTSIRATFRAPLLLLHTHEDVLTPQATVHHPPTEKRFRSTLFPLTFCWFDWDYDRLHPILTTHLKAEFLPRHDSMASWHFYRHSLAGSGLTAWELLEALSHAGLTVFSVEQDKVTFAGDRRKAP